MALPYTFHSLRRFSRGTLMLVHTASTELNSTRLSTVNRVSAVIFTLHSKWKLKIMLLHKHPFAIFTEKEKKEK